MPCVNSHCCRKRKVYFSFVTMHLKWSRKKIILQYLQIPPKILQALSALHLESLITHSLNLRTCQHLHWSEANKPVLMEMEVSKVSVCQHPAGTLTEIHKEDSHAHAFLWPCCWSCLRPFSLNAALHKCTDVLCKAVGLSLHCTLARLHQNE